MPAMAHTTPATAQRGSPVMKLPGRMLMPCRNQMPPRRMRMGARMRAEVVMGLFGIEADAVGDAGPHQVRRAGQIPIPDQVDQNQEISAPESRRAQCQGAAPDGSGVDLVRDFDQAELDPL